MLLSQKSAHWAHPARRSLGGVLLREVDEAWATIGDCPPVGHRLKIDLRERWVRFYSLPDGQRYPQSPADHEEIHRRVDCLVSDVCDLGDDIVLVIGRYGPPGNPPPISEAQATVQVDPVHWREVNLPPDPGEDIDDNWPLHLWASLHRYAPRSLDPLVRRIAEYGLAEVLLIAPKTGVALHPYDGGTDMILADPRQRNTFRDRHRHWASPHPDGY